MTINQIISYILAFGALLGGVDRVLGNKLGYGEKFENGFRMLGPVALAMAGIICLAPVMSAILEVVVSPVCNLLNMDPGIFGSILAIDMGGCQLSIDLASDSQFGLFSGVIVSSIFGCTVVFSIPVGLGFIREDDRPYFTKGILLGLATMPVSIIVSALMLRLPLINTLWNCLPVLLISALLAIGVVKKPDAMMKGFQSFAKGIRTLAMLGLTLAAFTHLTGIAVLQQMQPLQDAMKTVSAICIVMLGSMPLAELLQRVLAVPFGWVGKHTGLNQTSTTGLLVGMVSVTPALAMVPRMENRGKVVNGAFLVCAASSFAAHLGYTLTAEPDLAAALLTTKFTGGALAVILALAVTGKNRTP